MNKHKRSKMLPMTKIWRRKVKRVPSSYTKMQERTPCEITNKQMTKLSINSPHQVETASEHLEETMKIEEVPDTSRQPTSWVSSKSVSTTGKMMRRQQIMLSFKNCVPRNRLSNQLKTGTFYNQQVR